MIGNHNMCGWERYLGADFILKCSNISFFGRINSFLSNLYCQIEYYKKKTSLKY